MAVLKSEEGTSLEMLCSPSLLGKASLAALLVIGAACSSDDVSVPPIVWQGDHVQVGTNVDLDAWCPGTLPRLDGQAGALKQLFGAPEDFLVTYYLYTASSFDGVCPHGTGCHRYGAVFAFDLLHLHEVVHAVFYAHLGMPQFFAEGGASYWGFSRNADYDDLDIRQVLDESWSKGMSANEYALAAHFTSYLIHTHGIAPYVALLDGAPADQSRDDFEKTFEHAFGRTLDESIADYEEQWEYCPTWAIQRPFYECSQPAITLPPEQWTELELDISCANPDVVGPSAWASGTLSEPRIWRDITIDVESPTVRVVIDLPESGDPDAVQFLLKPCDTDCFNVAFTSLHLTADGAEHLWLGPRGRYVVRVSRAADEPGPVRVRMHP